MFEVYPQAEAIAAAAECCNQMKSYFRGSSLFAYWLTQRGAIVYTSH